MAIFNYREHTVTHREYVMPNPVNLAEFEKAKVNALRDFQALNERDPYDNEISVKSTDEEIIISFEWRDN